jgi:hypothetical protein
VDHERRTVRFLAQSTRLASDGYIITSDAGSKGLAAFMSNPIVTPYHLRAVDNAEPVVVGSVVETEFAPEGMYQTVEFAKTDLAEDYWSLYRDGHMRAVSIGFLVDPNDVVSDPKQVDKILRAERIKVSPEERAKLYGVITGYHQRELSLVAIGADPAALARAADDGNGAARSMLDRGEDGEDLVEDPLAKINARLDDILELVTRIAERDNQADDKADDGQRAADAAAPKTVAGPDWSRAWPEILKIKEN